MRHVLVVLGLASAVLFTETAAGQAGGRTGGGAATAPAAAGGLPVKNIEKQLENPVTLDAEKTTLAEFIDSLRKITTTNITVNWNALAAAGLTRETPVTLHLKDVPYEYAVKTLLDTLPVKEGDPAMRVNYVVGDNTLSLTTNAELGKGAVPRVYAFARPQGIAGAEAVSDKVIESVVKTQLICAGEPMTAAGHAVGIKGDTLVASVSERGHMLIGKVRDAFATPTRPGQLPPGIAQTATAKRGQDAINKAAGGPAKVTSEWMLAVGRDPSKFAGQGMNVALMAGTTEELAKPAPEIGGTVNEGGVLLIGPRAALRARTVFAAYDLRDALRRQATAGARGQRGAPAGGAPGPEALIRLLDRLKEKVPADGGWGSVDDSGTAKTPIALVQVGTMLVVFAPADIQRQVSAALASNL